MANPRNLVFGLLCLFAVLMQGCISEEEKNLNPTGDSVPERVENGEKGTLQYNEYTIKLTGNKHHKTDHGKNDGPPWPPRPGRRISIQAKAKKALPAIIRPGRSVLDSFQAPIFRPGRENVPDGIPPILRPGREDVPSRPERNAVPQMFRPGREYIPQHKLLRPGRNNVPDGPQYFRPGRENVPQMFRPGRNDIPDQFHSVRAGRRSLGYNIPWTYESNHNLGQKALKETTKRNLQDNEKKISDQNSFQDEPQDF